jgi:hypothetical protein
MLLLRLHHSSTTTRAILRQQLPLFFECVFVYYGTTEVFEIFHRNALINYNISSPASTGSHGTAFGIYLETNATAYLTEQRILRYDTLAKYFCPTEIP